MTKALTPKPLTIREAKWIARVNKALKACPSKRLGFYTTGDRDVSVYDLRFDNAISDIMDGGNSDFAPAVDELDAGLGSLNFPTNVHSTAA